MKNVLAAFNFFPHGSSPIHPIGRQSSPRILYRFQHLKDGVQLVAVRERVLLLHGSLSTPGVMRRVSRETSRFVRKYHVTVGDVQEIVSSDLRCFRNLIVLTDDFQFHEIITCYTCDSHVMNLVDSNESISFIDILSLILYMYMVV
jgi:hypothetical protein